MVKLDNSNYKTRDDLLFVISSPCVKAEYRPRVYSRARGRDLLFISLGK